MVDRKSQTQLEAEVLANLNQLIVMHLNNAANEQYAPSACPDQMDHKIADGKERAGKLRNLREEFENIVTGIL
jgi:hypothetical protein